MPVTIYRGGETNFLTMEALRAVLQHEQPAALAEVLRDMERARMTAEDWRGAMESPYGNNVHTRDPNYRMLSWREFGQERDEMCERLVNVNAEAREATHDAVETLAEARRDIRVALAVPGSNCEEIRRAGATALGAAYNAMIDAESILIGDPSSDEEEEEEEEEVEGVDIHAAGPDHV